MTLGAASPRMIEHVTEAVLEILRGAVADITPTVDVLDAPPDVIAQLGSAQVVDLYLYRVVESPDLRNQGPYFEPVANGSGAQQIQLRRDPLAVNLHYLLIPYALQEGSYRETYHLLGRAMKALHQQAIFSPGAMGIDVAPDEMSLEYRITQEPLTVSELGQIWEAVHQPYRLSVSYVVRTVQIRSEDTEVLRRVTTRRIVGSQHGSA